MEIEDLEDISGPPEDPLTKMGAFQEKGLTKKKKIVNIP